MSSSPTTIETIARGLLVRDGRALLCRNDKLEYLYLPGGHIEFAEPAAQALRREFLEETGLAVRVGACLLVTENVFSAKRRHHEVNLVFHVEQEDTSAMVVSQEPKISFHWIEPAAATDLDIRPASTKALIAAGGKIASQEPGGFWISEIENPRTGA